MDNSITGALIGIGGSLFGALIGGVCSYIGSKKMFNYQIEYEKQKREKEEADRLELSKHIFKLFLMEEVIVNYNNLKDDISVYNYFLQNNYDKNYTCNWSYSFCYNEYDKIKYDLVKYKNQTINDLLEIYKMFYLLSNKKSSRELSEQTFNFIKQTIHKLDKVISTL